MPKLRNVKRNIKNTMYKNELKMKYPIENIDC